MAVAEDLRPQLATGVEHKLHGRYGLVASPGGAEHLHLEPAAYELVRSLDGSRDVASLRAEHGPEAVELLEAMWDGGFLVGSPPASTPRVAVTFEGIELRGYDRVAGAVHRLVGRYVFTRAAAVVMTGVAAVGLAAFVGQLRGDESMTVGTASPVAAFFVLRVLGFVAVFLHETGHAIVLKHAGRRVGRVGIGFYWGSLTFYVDASDGLFCDRRTRMLQAAAGTITDLVVCGAAAVIALPGGDAGWATVLRELAALGYLAVLIDSAPLLELDGYWFLADALDRPTLDHDSRLALRGLLRRQPASRGLAVYRLVSIAFGVGLFAFSLGGWWYLFGDLFRVLWGGGILYRVLGVLLVLPAVAIFVHPPLRLAGSVAERLRARAERGEPTKPEG